MHHCLISTLLALGLLSPSSLAIKTPDKYLISGSVLAALGITLGTATAYYLANDSQDSSEKHNGLIAGDVIGWAMCTTGLGLVITGLVKKFCTSTTAAPPTDPTTEEPVVIPVTTTTIPQKAPMAPMERSLSPAPRE